MNLDQQCRKTDVDAIPILRLDDPLPTSQSTDELHLLRDDTSIHTTRAFTVDREGEMPAVVSPSPIAESGVGIAATNRLTPSPLPASSQVYDTGEEAPRTTTPDPIKVTRSKKKGTGTGKKKRTSK